MIAGLVCLAAMFGACTSAERQVPQAECLPDVAPQGDDGEPTPEQPGASLREIAEPVMSAIDAEPEHFGGSYINRPQTALCVFYVGEKEGARARLASQLRPELPVAWIRVDHSSARLSQIKAEIIDLWQAAGIARINAVSVDVRANRVVVSVPIAQPALTGEIIARYGSAVTVEVEPADEPAGFSS